MLNEKEDGEAPCNGILNIKYTFYRVINLLAT
jgi:hypothetical protein